MRVHPPNAEVWLLKYSRPEHAGKWRGLAVLIYGTAGPIHNAAYVGKLSGWAAYPKTTKYLPHIHQVVKTTDGGLYTPFSYNNSWSMGLDSLASNQLFSGAWQQLLPAEEYMIRLYFKDGSDAVTLEL